MTSTVSSKLVAMWFTTFAQSFALPTNLSWVSKGKGKTREGEGGSMFVSGRIGMTATSVRDVNVGAIDAKTFRRS